MSTHPVPVSREFLSVLRLVLCQRVCMNENLKESLREHKRAKDSLRERFSEQGVDFGYKLRSEPDFHFNTPWRQKGFRPLAPQAGILDFRRGGLNGNDQNKHTLEVKKVKPEKGTNLRKNTAKSTVISD